MNKVAISIGPIMISWYSICILVGIIFAGIIINKEAKKNKIPSLFITNLIFWCVIFGILGARIYYVLFNLDYYMNYPSEIIKIWNGGLAIHGGLILGLITLIIYCKNNKINILKILDMIVPGLILAQGIGRWGNFFNQEAYGSVVSRTFLENLRLPEFIINGMYINGNYYHPTFLYESIFCLLGCLILILIRTRKKVKTGNTFSVYLIWYGILRFFIESLRTDSLMLGNIKIAQIISALMIFVGIILLLITIVKCNNYKDEKAMKNEITS